MSRRNRWQQRSYRVYVGGLSQSTSIPDLQYFFRRFERRFDVLLKERFAFIVSVVQSVKRLLQLPHDSTLNECLRYTRQEQQRNFTELNRSPSMDNSAPMLLYIVNYCRSLTTTAMPTTPSTSSTARTCSASGSPSSTPEGREGLTAVGVAAAGWTSTDPRPGPTTGSSSRTSLRRCLGR